MAKPFDASLNSLNSAFQSNWCEYLAKVLGLPIAPVTPLDTDLSGTLQTDLLFQFAGSHPGIVHLELESSSRLGIPARLQRYNITAAHQYNLPFSSVLMLLRRSAFASDQTGMLEVAGVTGQTEHSFKYHIVKLWEEKVDTLMAAGLGLAPLALLTDEASGDLPSTLERVRERLQVESVTDTLKRDVLSSTYILCGLRYPESQLIDLYRDLAMTLEDSTTYQSILQKGEKKGEEKGELIGLLKGERSACLGIGAKRLVPPPASITAAMDQIMDLERLERMIDRILDAPSWENLHEMV